MRWKKGMLIYNENAGNGKLERNLEGCLPVIAPHIDEFLILQTKEKGPCPSLMLPQLDEHFEESLRFWRSHCKSLQVKFQTTAASEVVKGHLYTIFGEWGLFQMHQAILMSRKKAGSER